MLDMKANHGELRLGCADLLFPQPPALDASGGFRVTGTWSNGTAGPQHGDAPPPSMPAQVTGTLAGDQLTLSIRHGGATTRIALQRGQFAKVIRCM